MDFSDILTKTQIDLCAGKHNLFHWVDSFQYSLSYYPKYRISVSYKCCHLSDGDAS